MMISEEKIYTVLINKSKLFGQALEIFLAEKIPSISILKSCHTAINAYDILGIERIDLLIIDARLEGEPAQNAVTNLKEFYPDLYVIALVENKSLESINAIHEIGVNKIIFNYLETSEADLLNAIRIQFLDNSNV